MSESGEGRAALNAAQASSSPPCIASLRVHPAVVSALDFHRGGLFLASGDESGWVYVWSLVSRRAMRRFRPHSKSIIVVRWIGNWLLTHGRDNKLHIFDLSEIVNAGIEEHTKSGCSATQLGQLAQNDDEDELPKKVHSQDVNALNFCGAAIDENTTNKALLIALPNTMDSHKVDLYNLDLETKKLSRPLFALEPNIFDPAKGENVQTGIVMALHIHKSKTVFAGFESGHIIGYDVTNGSVLYTNHTHTQPILAFSGYENTLVATSVDSLITKHDMDALSPATSYNTKHSGLNSIDVRSDGQLVATSGWDGMVRVFRFPTPKPLALIHPEGQVNIVRFGPIAAPDVAKDLPMVLKRRLSKIQATHWLAAGAKDGRISLYEVY